MNWTDIGTILSIAALLAGGFLWLATKIFQLGQTSQRLDAFESDLATVKQEVQATRKELSGEINSVHQRIDKLILTIAESNKR